MKYKETIFIVNVFLIIQLLISGINFPLSKLPSLFNVISRFTPLPYLVEAISVRKFNEQWFISISNLAVLSILFFIVSVMIFRKQKINNNLGVILMGNEAPTHYFKVLEKH